MAEQSITAYEDLQFAPLGAGSPVEIAVLWGDPATGPAAVMVRFPEGHAEPRHSHSSTYRSVLVRGEFRTRGGASLRRRWRTRAGLRCGIRR